MYNWTTKKSADFSMTQDRAVELGELGSKFAENGLIFSANFIVRL